MSVTEEPEQSSDVAAPDPIAASALEDVQFLCRQRFGAIRSPDFFESDLTGFEQRLAGYVDVIVVRGRPACEWLAKILPGAATAADACGIAIVLLEARDPQSAQAVLAALETADQSPLLQGLHMALRRGPIAPLAETLRQWFAAGTSRQASAAAEVLAFHGDLEADSHRLAQLLGDADPQVRQAAWRATALAG